MRKNNLDEMQEQKLLKIEHNGAWFSFWALLAAILIQAGMGASFRQIAGEWIVFMALALYLCVACIKAGIWDRQLKPTLKTNVSVSAVAAISTSLIIGVSNYLRYQDVGIAGLTTAIIAIAVFILTIITLQISKYLYKSRIRHLEQKCENGGDMDDGSSH